MALRRTPYRFGEHCDDPSSMHVETSAGFASEAIVCHVVVSVVTHRGHQRLLNAERSLWLVLTYTHTRLLHCLIRIDRVLGNWPNLTDIEIRVFSLLLEQDHDLSDLCTAQRSAIIYDYSNIHPINQSIMKRRKLS